MTSEWLDQDSAPPSTMLTASFNQDGGCLAIGTSDGFQVFNLNPFTNSVTRPLSGSIGRVEMLFRCNVMALVGDATGEHPYAPAHRVLIWDDHVGKAIGELSFRQVVLSVKLRRDSIAVALRDRAYVYHLSDLSLRDKIYTTDNPHGLLDLSTAVQDMVLCCPSVTDGHVRVELYGLRKTVLIEAHDSPLRSMALTDDGASLATASLKGTVIRVFDVATATCTATFRRGVERVHMTCLAWSLDQEHLACCSEKGTTHVFHVEQQPNTTTTANHSTKKKKKSWYDKVRGSIEGNVQHSISQIRGSVVHPLACAFLPDPPHTIAVVGWDVDGNGVLSISDYSREEAIRKSYHVICKSTTTTADDDETEGQRRRKLKLGLTSKNSNSSTTAEDEAKLYVGERVEVLENQMKEIRFEEDDQGFLNVFGATTTTTTTDNDGKEGTADENKEDEQQEDEANDDPDDDDDASPSFEEPSEEEPSAASQ